MIVIDQEEIIEIAADLSGRIHRRVDIEFAPLREGREDAREHALLDLIGHVQLRADPLLLRGDGFHFIHIQHCPVRKFGKRFRKYFDLIPCAELIFHLEFQICTAKRRNSLCDRI